LSYGHTLLRIQETFFAPPAIAGLAPCVRNHPTLLQRITMIARPHRNRPWLQAVFTLAFGVITCYAFTTASASAEKDLPAKDRSREGQRGSTETEDFKSQEKRVNEIIAKELPKGVTVTKSTIREDGIDFEGLGGSLAAVLGFKDVLETSPELSAWMWDFSLPVQEPSGKFRFVMIGRQHQEVPKSADGEGGKKPGMGDREGGPRTGPRDGDGEKKGPRDGDKPRTGSRDGDRTKMGERDGDKPRTGERDGDRPKTGERDGDKGRESAEKNAGRSSSQETLTLRVINQGNTVLVAGEEVPMNRLRGRLQSYLPDHPSASVIINAEDDVPYKALTGVLDAVRDNGNKNVRISAE
jgi:hypothetical protein